MYLVQFIAYILWACFILEWVHIKKKIIINIIINREKKVFVIHWQWTYEVSVCDCVCVYVWLCVCVYVCVCVCVRKRDNLFNYTDCLKSSKAITGIRQQVQY